MNTRHAVIHNPRSFDYWKNLVAAATRGMNDAQIHKAAKLCAVDDALGRKVSAWHSASVILGNERCGCWDCEHRTNFMKFWHEQRHIAYGGRTARYASVDEYMFYNFLAG